MERTKVIKVEDNELSIWRAKKEADKAERAGYKVAYDLRSIKDKELIREIIKFTQE